MEVINQSEPLNTMPDGTCRTIKSQYFKNSIQNFENQSSYGATGIIVAMRGRNPDNPSDRTAGSPTEQRLEPNSQGICNTLTSVQKDNMVLIKQATKKGYAECECGGIADLSFPQSRTRRGRVQGNSNICPTITAESNGLCRIETQYRIRKLTPLECWRLMGFSDEDFRKAEEANSNTQLYKQAGNSIVKNVLMAILGQITSGN